MTRKQFTKPINQTLSFLAAFAFVLATLTSTALADATITINPAQTYQTIKHWAATDYMGQHDSPAFDLYKDELLDRLVNELGITRVRLEIRSSSENPNDHWADYQNGTIDYATWRLVRYEIINDNADPNVINPAGFHYTELDWVIENIVLPMKQLVEANGDIFWVNFNYVDFGASTFEHCNYPEEYAEYMLAAFQHMDTTYSLIPDSIEVILEPDNTGGVWDEYKVASCLVAAGNRLAAAGYTPGFSAPSTMSMNRVPAWFDTMIATQPTITNYWTEISYHRYSASSSTPAQIASRAATYNMESAHLEKIGAGISALHQDLTVTNNSTWQQYVMATLGADDGGGYYLINDDDPANPIITMGSRTHAFMQYFPYIRNGAVRIGATSTSSLFNPAVFQRPNGENVVVVHTGQAGQITVQGLPQGTYGINYATTTQHHIPLPEVTITTGQPLITNMPTTGALTIFPTVLTGGYYQVFYNNSSYDGNDPAANSADQNALATDKQVLTPGQTATFNNVTSYHYGINGLFIDLPNIPAPITAGDLQFKVGTNPDPTTWTNAPAPTTVTTTTGQGIGGRDRVTVIFPDNAIKNTWLQVTIPATPATNLATPEIFYICNAPGDTGNSATDLYVNATDEINARNNLRHFMKPAAIDDHNDHNRDGKVDATDEIISRNHPTDFSNALPLLIAP